MIFLKDTLSFLPGAIVLYICGYTLSDQSSISRFIFKSFRLPIFLRELMRPSFLIKNGETDRINIAGIILHSMSTIPLLVLFPVYVIMYLTNKELVMTIIRIWGRICFYTGGVLIVMYVLDAVISDIYNRFIKK